jgi:hypothetical protein
MLTLGLKSSSYRQVKPLKAGLSTFARSVTSFFLAALIFAPAAYSVETLRLGYSGANATQLAGGNPAAESELTASLAIRKGD